MKRLFDRERDAREQELLALQVEATRGRILIEESREIVVVLDDQDRVVTASRRAWESLEGLREGAPIPDGLLRAEGTPAVVRVPVEVDGRHETLVYMNEPGELAAYEELRAGFTAAVSHELRTPLARLLALLETALLPDSNPEELIEQARLEVEEIRELIDDVLFLSELETGHQVVSLTSTSARPAVDQVVRGLQERSERAGITIVVDTLPDIDVPLRPRMLRVLVQNLAENAIRYAGVGATLRISLREAGSRITLEAADNGIGVPDDDLPRLFERFYRSDRSRASRGTGLGLAIVKHIVTSAGGSVEASRSTGRGLSIRCLFPTP